MADITSILNTIRANSSTEYQDRVPLATRTNITEVGAPILQYQVMQNEFLNALINRIAMTVVYNKTFKNPLAILKKGTVPLGSDIQEIYTNMATDTGFDGSGSKLLTKTLPDTKALYQRLNRQGQYPVTITREQLKLAFTSFAEMETLINSIITSLYSGDNYDEFILMKNVFADAITTGKIVKSDIVKVTDEVTGKKLIKDIKKTSKAFTFPSTAFNKYFENKPASDKGKAVTTWTPIQDQLLLIRADVMTDIDVDVLAAAFNLSKLEFLAQSMEVDSFGSASNCVAVLIDRSWLQVWDNLNEMTDFHNPQGLFWNYWYNHWQTYGYSLFANAVAFMEIEEPTE